MKVKRQLMESLQSGEYKQPMLLNEYGIKMAESKTEYFLGLLKQLEDFKIGCILLTQPFFFEKSKWFPAPEWSTPIVRGKGYGLDTEGGKFILRKVEQLLEEGKELYLDSEGKSIIEEHERYGKEILIKPRLGQGIFKILVTDAYNRSCAITRERTLPVLEAAHIKPYKEGGLHRVENGILLRSDIHRLFDSGYVTVTTDHDFEVSKRIREEFHNGKYYLTFHGTKIHTPPNPRFRPSPEFLLWHNENVFKG